jgi:hypothetical protein
MFRLRTIFVVLVALLGVSGVAKAFSLMGPRPDWQQPRVGYGISVYQLAPPEPFQVSDFGGLMTIGEEYRVNTPVLYYAFDESFLRFFGTDGSNAIEQAIQILNALPPVTQMSSDLSEFPLDAQRINFRAQSLFLYDVKSTALGILMQQMGLTSPERYVWSLRDFEVFANGTATNFFVFQGNYDPISYDPTPYINGNLYTYTNIFLSISPPLGYPQVSTFDPLEPPATTVASIVGSGPNDYRNWLTNNLGFPVAESSSSLSPGGFFQSLTRDDAGGLKFLLGTNVFQRKMEALLPDTRVVATNFLSTVTVPTRDLEFLLRNTVHTTNDPATVSNLFPGLSISLVSSNSGILVHTNVTTYFTNWPCNPRRVFERTYSNEVVTFYDYTFGNVITDFAYTNEVGDFVNNQIYTEREIRIRTIEIVPAESWGPGQTSLVQTNVLDETTITQVVTNGEYILGPQNLAGFLNLTNNPFCMNIGPGFANLTMIPGVPAVTNYTTNIDFFARGAEFTIFTNRNETHQLVTLDLPTFAWLTLTNGPDELTGIEGLENLMIINVQTNVTPQITSNLVTVFTNQAFDVASGGSSLEIVQYVTNLNAFDTTYTYTFGNVMTNSIPPPGRNCEPSTFGWFIVENNLWAIAPWINAFAQPTNIVFSNMYFGNFLNGYITVVPTNWVSYEVVSAYPVPGFFTNTVVITNRITTPQGTLEQTNFVSLLIPVTNYLLNVHPIQFVSTNDLNSNNVFGVRREIISSAITRNLRAFPIELNPGTNALRPGLEKISFQKIDFYSLFSTNFLPITNCYIDTYISNSIPIQQTAVRIVRRPDILFTAEDLGTVFGIPTPYGRTFNYQNNNALNGDANLAGPGVIPGADGDQASQIRIFFSRVGPYYWNYHYPGDFYLNQAPPYHFAWGSFDGSTNTPIVYPTGSSITNLESQILSP